MVWSLQTLLSTTWILLRPFPEPYNLLIKDVTPMVKHLLLTLGWTHLPIRFTQNIRSNTKLTSLYKLIIELIYIYLWILDAQVQTIQITVLDSDPINYIIIYVMSHVKLPHKSDTRHDILPQDRSVYLRFICHLDMYSYPKCTVYTLSNSTPRYLYSSQRCLPGVYILLKMLIVSTSK